MDARKIKKIRVSFLYMFSEEWNASKRVFSLGRNKINDFESIFQVL